MLKEKKQSSRHYRDRTICCLACFGFAYAVAGALMASPGIRVVLDYPLFKTGSVIWGGILVFAIGIYILALCRCMEYLNKLKVAVIMIMQIIVCVICVANIPILKCVEWKYFNSVSNENGEVIEDNRVIYIAYLLPLVGTVIGMVSSVFGIAYTVIITSRIRSRLKHYLTDLERIHQSPERKMSPIYDDTTDIVQFRESINVSPCSWVFQDDSTEKLTRKIPSYVTGLPSETPACCDETVLTSIESTRDDQFMDKRLIRRKPVTKQQKNGPSCTQVAIQDYLSHEEKTLIPPNPSLRYDQVLVHPCSRPPSVISIVSNSTIKRNGSLTTDKVVSETGLNTTAWAMADYQETPNWPSPPSCVHFDPFNSTNTVLNDEVIPAPLNFQDKPKSKEFVDRPKCLVPNVIIAEPPDPPKLVVDENDNSVVSCYYENSLTPRIFKHLTTFKGNVQAVKPLIADIETPVLNDLSRQGSMCNLMGDPSPMFDMSCTRL